MIRYFVENFVDIADELEPLFKLHWEEVARHQDTIKLDVDWEGYSKLEQLGILHVITAREGDTLIGYIMVVVCPSLHYKSNVMATEDILFVHPQYRRGRTFVTMLQFAEDYFREIGVTNFYIHMKTAHDFSPILNRAGYTEIEKKFEKQL